MDDFRRIYQEAMIEGATTVTIRSSAAILRIQHLQILLPPPRPARLLQHPPASYLQTIFRI